MFANKFSTHHIAVCKWGYSNGYWQFVIVIGRAVVDSKVVSIAEILVTW